MSVNSSSQLQRNVNHSDPPFYPKGILFGEHAVVYGRVNHLYPISSKTVHLDCNSCFSRIVYFFMDKTIHRPEWSSNSLVSTRHWNYLAHQLQWYQHTIPCWAHGHSASSSNNWNTQRQVLWNLSTDYSQPLRNHYILTSSPLFKNRVSTPIPLYFYT